MRHDVLPVPRPEREVGTVGVLLSRVSKGVRTTVNQVGPYGEWWDEHNLSVVSTLSAGRAQRWWAALGDSTAQGVGASSPEGGWVRQLSRMLDDAPPLLNLSVSGARTTDLIEVQLPRFGLLVEAYGPPELVTVAIGANDVSFAPNPRRLARRLAEIAGELPGGSYLSALPQAPGGGLAKLANGALEAASDRHDHSLARLNDHYRWPYKDRLAADRFHPNDAGYQDWAEAFAAAIDRRRGGVSRSR